MEENKSNKLGNANVRRAFNAAKKICEIDQDGNTFLPSKKSSTLKSLDKFTAEKKEEKSSKQDEIPVWARLTQEVSGTVRGQKMIKKALNFCGPDPSMQQNETESNDSSKLLEIDKFIKSYRRAKPNKTNNINLREIVKDEIKRFKLHQRKISYQKNSRKGGNKKTIIRVKEETTSKEEKPRLPLIFSAEQHKPKKDLIPIPKIMKTERSMQIFSFQDNPDVEIHKVRSSNASRESLAVSSRRNSQMFASQPHLTPQKKTFLTKIDTGLRRQSMRGSFDLEKVQQELDIMNLKVLNKIKKNKILKKCLPSLSPAKQRGKGGANLDLIPALKREDSSA